MPFSWKDALGAVLFFIPVQLLLVYFVTDGFLIKPPVPALIFLMIVGYGLLQIGMGISYALRVWLNSRKAS